MLGTACGIVRVERKRRWGRAGLFMHRSSRDGEKINDDQKKPDDGKCEN
jgi:hypothetical protein